MHASFKPGKIVGSPHFQSLAASSKLRNRKIHRAAKSLFNDAEEVVIDCEDGERLLGFYSSPQGAIDRLVILIHGWEGSSESIYIKSASAALFNAGFDVFRLNLRDHGPSHHLNHELFHAQRLEEVLSAVKNIAQKYEKAENYLVGFSLGGNFALRVAANSVQRDLGLNKVMAVSPVFNPVLTYASMKNGPKIYNDYFLKKWKRSLNKKTNIFPHVIRKTEFKDLQDIFEITDYLVNHHTPFNDINDYLNSYRVDEELLKQVELPTKVVVAQDDPVIPYESLVLATDNDNLEYILLDHGGHCGFVKNLRCDSWIDQEILHTFAPFSASSVSKV